MLHASRLAQRPLRTMKKRHGRNKTGGNRWKSVRRGAPEVIARILHHRLTPFFFDDSFIYGRAGGMNEKVTWAAIN